MPAGDVYVVDFWQSVKGNPVLNSLAYLQTTNETDPLATNVSIINGFLAAVADLWATVLSEDWKGDLVQLRCLTPGPINPYSTVLAGGEAVVGAVTEEAIPSNSPLVVSKYTTLASKRGRGRWYQSGIPEGSQDGGQITTADLGSFVTAAQGLKAELSEVAAGVGRWRPCVVSLATFGVIDANLITDLTVRPNLANMRPRRSPPLSA